MPHKLLLADDSVTIQRVIELTFAEEDITVIAVGDGRQAIERVQADRPDIVLADVGMPERDGYEVAAFIKGSPELAHIPVLLLTGAFEPIDEGKAQAAGCDGVLVKPFEPQMVISRVKDLIAGRRPVQKMPASYGAPSAPEAIRPASSVPQTTPAPETGPAGTIEDYFDRLDAAFASLDGPVAAPPGQGQVEPFKTPRPATPSGNAGLADELANWDPDLGPPRDPAPVATSPAPPAAPAPRAAPPESAPAAAPTSGSAASSAPVPTLAEAFAALLAAEQGQAFAPAAITRPAADVGEDLVEQVTRRVIERLGDAAVRDIVTEVAERLVREEIARIKNAAR